MTFDLLVKALCSQRSLGSAMSGSLLWWCVCVKPNSSPALVPASAGKAVKARVDKIWHQRYHLRVPCSPLTLGLWVSGEAVCASGHEAELVCLVQAARTNA